MKLSSRAQSVAAGDFDGDGDLDLAVVGDTGYIALLENQGKGSFAAPRNLAKGNRPTFVRAGDLDGDGQVDLVVGNWGYLLPLWNDGKGGFSEGSKLPLLRHVSTSR